MSRCFSFALADVTLASSAVTWNNVKVASENGHRSRKWKWHKKIWEAFENKSYIDKIKIKLESESLPAEKWGEHGGTQSWERHLRCLQTFLPEPKIEVDWVCSKYVSKYFPKILSRCFSNLWEVHRTEVDLSEVAADDYVFKKRHQLHGRELDSTKVQFSQVGRCFHLLEMIINTFRNIKMIINTFKNITTIQKFFSQVNLLVRWKGRRSGRSRNWSWQGSQWSAWWGGWWRWLF